MFNQNLRQQLAKFTSSRYLCKPIHTGYPLRHFTVKETLPDFKQRFGATPTELRQKWFELEESELQREFERLNISELESQFEAQLKPGLKGIHKLRNVIDVYLAQQTIPNKPINKDEMLDKWLEMTNQELQAECEHFGLEKSERHIDNIQKLIKMVKQADKRESIKEKQFEPLQQSELHGRRFKKKVLVDQESADVKQIKGDAKQELNAELKRMFQNKKALSSKKFNLFSDKQKSEEPKTEKVGGLTSSLPQFAFQKQDLMTNFIWKKNQVLESKDQDISRERFDLLLDHISAIKGNLVNKEASSEQFQNLNAVQKSQVLTQMSVLFKGEKQDPNKFMFAADQVLNDKVKNLDKYWLQLNSQNKQLAVQDVISEFQAQTSEQKQSLPLEVRTSLVNVLCKNEFPQVNYTDFINTEILTKGFLNDALNSVKHDEKLQLFTQLGKTIKNMNNFISVDIKSKTDIHDLTSKFISSDLVLKKLSELTEPVEHLSLPDKVNLLQVFAKNPHSDSLRQLQSELLEQIFKDSQRLLIGISYEQMYDCVERTMMLAENRDLQNKMKNSLLAFVKNRHFKIDHQSSLQLMKLLSSEFDSKTQSFKLTKGRMDSNIFEHMLRNNHMFQFADIKTQESFRAFIEVMELQHAQNPLNLYRSQNITSSYTKQIIPAITALVESQKVKLEDMMRFTTISNPSQIDPSFLFQDMCVSEESFSHLDIDRLNFFTEVLLKRIDQLKVQFDHLRGTRSHVHSSFKQYNSKKTFQLFSKIAGDFVYDPQSKDLSAVNKVMSQVPLKLFESIKDAEVFIEKYLQKVNSVHNINVSQHQLIDQLKALKAIRPLISLSSQEQLQKQADKTLQLVCAHIFDYLENLDQDKVQLQDILGLNSALLESIESASDREVAVKLMDKYQDLTFLPVVVDNLMEYHYGDKAAGLITAPEIAKQIKNISKINLEHLAGPLISHYKVYAELLWLPKEQAELISSFLVDMKSSRSLQTDDLKTLFQLLPNLQESNSDIDDSKFDKIVLNVSSNLKTLGVDLVMQKNYAPTSEHVTPLDSQFLEINEQILSNLESLQLQVLHQYLNVHKKRPEAFIYTGDKVSNLRPLSMIVNDVFEQLDNYLVLDCMKMLGSNSIENYESNFIHKLFTRYSSTETITQMHQQNPQFFLEFAKAWPKFLRNPAILTQLTRLKSASILVGDQSKTLEILREKNVLHPELLDVHFQTLIRMRDRETVANYLHKYVKSCAYFGYADKNMNIQQLTQLLRRLFKQPQEVDPGLLLDYLLVLAVSGRFYGDFDEKSVQFIEKAIDLVETRFTGMDSVLASRNNSSKEQQTNLNPKSEDAIAIQFFKQIDSPQRTYNKVKELMEPRNVQFKQMVARVKNSNEDQLILVEDEDEEDAGRYRSDGEDANQSEDDDLSVDEEVSIEEEELEAKKQYSKQKQATERKSYDRKAGDSKYREEVEYDAYKRQKFSQLDKKSKHMLVYSNINRNNFTQLHDVDAAKAWVILFHFKNKSVQSMLYEEFSAVALRNCISKSRTNVVATKVHSELLLKSFENNFRVTPSQVCSNTGWPIDFQINTRTTRNQEGIVEQPNEVSLFFLMQEECCQNVKTGKEEPLTLQKLMISHMQSISGSKIAIVNESEAEKDLEGTVNKVLNQVVRRKQQSMSL